MEKKTVIIIVSVIASVVVATGLGVLIWWLVAGRNDYSIVELEGEGFQGVQHTAAFTRIRGAGDMFWLFYPATTAATTRPIVLWLDGLTGLPPSLFANFGMFGPLDLNLNRRTDSWIDEVNLLFVDAPLGTGFSTANSDSSIPSTLDENTNHLMFTLESFYYLHEEFQNAPLFIFGQGDGAGLALPLAIRINEDESFKFNLKGVALGNGIVSPALALTKLGFFLEEMGYIGGRGRDAIENFSNETNSLVNEGRHEEAFDKFITLGDFVNEDAGAIAVNIRNIIDKLEQGARTRDYFGQRNYLHNALRSDTEFNKFMEETVAPALGISDPDFDSQREAALQAFRGFYMVPTTGKVEHILQQTNLTVTIYNGNLDAVSNTPGQLEWVNNLEWPGQSEFLNSTRRPFVVNLRLDGHLRSNDRLRFYWLNNAGISIQKPFKLTGDIQKSHLLVKVAGGVDEGSAGPVVVAILGGGLCPAVDVSLIRPIFKGPTIKQLSLWCRSTIQI